MSNEHIEVLRQMWQQCANDRRMMEADALDAAIAALSAPQPPAEARRCTCPSGDGSLRWPCPAHPPSAPVGVEAIIVDMERWIRAVEASGPYAAGRTVVVQEWVKQLRAAQQPPAEAQPVAPTDGSPFDVAMREYESAAIKLGAGRNNANAKSVDAAADRVFALYNAKPPSAPVGVEAETLRRLAEGLDETARRIATTQPMGLAEWADRERECREASKILAALAQQPAATLSDVDDDLTVAYMAGRHDGRKEAQQPAVEIADTNAAVEAIQFALRDPEGMTFLRLWNEGEFDKLRKEWPEAPKEVFVGAEVGSIQQPAAVDGTMVERATMTLLGKTHDTAPGVDWRCDRSWTVNRVRELMRRALTAAFAGQQQGGPQE